MSDYGTLVAALGSMIIVVLAILVAAYVVSALSISRVLTIMNYDKPWMAWIPLANLYAIADAASGGVDYMVVFGKQLPVILFKLYWLIGFALSFIPGLGTILNIVVQIIGMGTVLKYVYAAIENKTIADVKVIAYVSGWIQIIAVIKFFIYDKNLRVDMASFRRVADAQEVGGAAGGYNGQPYGQAPQQPYGQAPQQPYGQAPQDPYAQAPQQPYAQAPQQPYGQDMNNQQ